MLFRSTENVSADIEVINTVKTIENHSPEKAKALVDDLKKTRGKENAREKVAAVKEEVKPSKKPKAPKADKENKAGSGQVATEKDRTAEEPGPVSVFAGEKIETVTEGKDPFADDQGEATQDAPRPVAFAPARGFPAATREGGCCGSGSQRPPTPGRGSPSSRSTD